MAAQERDRGQDDKAGNADGKPQAEPALLEIHRRPVRANDRHQHQDCDDAQQAFAEFGNRNPLRIRDTKAQKSKQSIAEKSAHEDRQATDEESVEHRPIGSGALPPAQQQRGNQQNCHNCGLHVA
jgi:hypothetical protein